MIYQKKNNGFTLIELLVVITIVAMLSTVIFQGLDDARKKARDAQRLADFASVRNALNLYYSEFGDYPQVAAGCCSSEDHNQHFEDVVQELVDEGFIPSIPRDPRHEAGSYYMFYDYGDGPAGALMVTYLEGVEPSTDGPNSSCRPFTNNWCSSTIASTAYCLCNTR
tara:strand:- start:1087 stop:1587 length:501 start_codon:yes stop_codon:yes gene_type:complete